MSKELQRNKLSKANHCYKRMPTVIKKDKSCYPSEDTSSKSVLGSAVRESCHNQGLENHSSNWELLQCLHLCRHEAPSLCCDSAPAFTLLNKPGDIVYNFIFLPAFSQSLARAQGGAKGFVFDPTPN